MFRFICVVVCGKEKHFYIIYSYSLKWCFEVSLKYSFHLIFLQFYFKKCRQLVPVLGLKCLLYRKNSTKSLVACNETEILLCVEKLTLTSARLLVKLRENSKLQYSFRLFVLGKRSDDHSSLHFVALSVIFIFWFLFFFI